METLSRLNWLFLFSECYSVYMTNSELRDVMHSVYSGFCSVIVLDSSNNFKF